MADALKAVRRLGLLGVMLLFASRSIDRLTKGRARLLMYYFMAQPVPNESGTAVRSTSIKVVELAANDARLSMLGRPSDEFERRFATRSRCFAAWHGDALTGFLWFTPLGYEEDESLHEIYV